jgi:chorismate mutase/prephenate dehydratase
VQETLGQLFEAQVRVIGDLYLKITQNLISAHPLNEIEVIYTHPHAYEQCRNFIAKYLPKATFVATKSTAAAAEITAQKSAKGEKCACIASDLAAREFNLAVVQVDIQDQKQNTTRFLIIAKEDISSSPSGFDLTWIVFGVHNVTGALSDALLIFARHGINMNALETRPNKIRDWQYDFMVEIQGHEQDLNVKSAIEELKAKTPFLNVMGSIPNCRIASPVENK